jgi:hypothetical protein
VAIVAGSPAERRRFLDIVLSLNRPGYLQALQRYRQVLKQRNVMLRDGAPRPAAILGMPVGFVGAAESKDALAAGDHGIPWAIVRGRLGGSAMTAAALNALARPGI